jgi:hypothetical protein
VFLPSNKSDRRGKAFPQWPTVTVKTISATVKIPRVRDAFSGWLVLLLLVLGSFRPPTGPARRYPSLSPGANSPRPSDPTRSSCCVATRPVGPSATVLSLSRWRSAARSRPLLPAETVAMLTTSRWAPGCDGGCASLCPGNSTSLPGHSGRQAYRFVVACRGEREGERKGVGGVSGRKARRRGSCRMVTWTDCRIPACLWPCGA